MSAFPLTRVPAEAPKPVKSARRPRVHTTELARVLLAAPGPKAAIKTALALGHTLRVGVVPNEFGLEFLHVWTEEAKP